MHTPGKVMKIKSEEKHENGKIYENKFGYNTKTGVYANKSSDMKKLAEIPHASKGINFKGFSRQRENFLNMCMYPSIQVNMRYEHDKQKNNSIS